MQKEHFSVLQNTPFRSQIVKIFFASGGKGAFTPLTIGLILRTFLLAMSLHKDGTLPIACNFCATRHAI